MSVPDFELTRLAPPVTSRRSDGPGRKPGNKMSCLSLRRPRGNRVVQMGSLDPTAGISFSATVKTPEQAIASSMAQTLP